MDRRGNEPPDGAGHGQVRDHGSGVRDAEGHGLGFSTRAIRAASRAPHLRQIPTSVPIYQTATFSALDADELAAARRGAGRRLCVQPDCQPDRRGPGLGLRGDRRR